MLADIFFFVYTTLFIYDCYTAQKNDYFLYLSGKDITRNREKYNVLSIFTHVSIYQYMVNGVAIFIIEPELNSLNILFILMLEKIYNKLSFGSTVFISVYMIFTQSVILSISYVVLSYISVNILIY